MSASNAANALRTNKIMGDIRLLCGTLAKERLPLGYRAGHPLHKRRRSPEWFCKPEVGGSIPSPGSKPFRRRAVSLQPKPLRSPVLRQIYPVRIPQSNQARCTTEVQGRPCAFAELGFAKTVPSSAKLISPRSNAAFQRAESRRPLCTSRRRALHVGYLVTDFKAVLPCLNG
jgi:hypothetical protein